MRAAHNGWYNLKRWKMRAAHQLHEHPLCKKCFERGLIVAAEVVDHVEPHNGNYHKFHFGTLQSLCKRCHDKTKRIEEMRGYNTEIGRDGFPIDRRHPFYVSSSNGKK